MSNKTCNIDVTNEDNCQSEIPKIENILESQGGINPIEIINIQKNEDNNLYTAEEKEYKNKSKMHIGAQLRSEFTDVNDEDSNHKLPTYKRVALEGNKLKKPGKKKPKVYSEDTVLVQFMGSEFLPENKVQMIYEPESRNFTVKSMFAMLLLMHLFTTLGMIYINYSDHDVTLFLAWYAPYLMVFSLLVIVILMMCMICLESMRIGWRSSVGVFGTLFAFVAFGSAFSNIQLFLNSKIFLTASVTMFWVDIICIIVGCTEFDYTSKLMYAIVVPPGLLIYTPIFMFFPLALQGSHWSVDSRFYANDFFFTTILILILLPVTVSELHIILDTETIELAEDDYFFGGYLLLISIVDCPIRHLRKHGFLGDRGRGEEEEEE